MHGRPRSDLRLKSCRAFIALTMRQWAAMLNCSHLPWRGRCEKRGSRPRLQYRWRARSLLHRSFKHFADVVPVHQMVEEGLQVIGSAIAIIDVIGVLPDIAAEYWPGAVHQRVLTVRRFHDRQFAILHRQPTPARTEL